MRRLYETTFTVAAGVAQAAPAVAAVALEDAKLLTVRIVVPDGHNALTGLQIRWSGVQVVPFGAGTFIVANDEIIDYPWDDEITAGGLQLAGFNTDVFPHSWYLRWVVDDLAAPAAAVISSASTEGAAPPDTGALAALTSASAAAAAATAAGGDLTEPPPVIVGPDTGPPTAEGTPVNLLMPTVGGGA